MIRMALLLWFSSLLLGCSLNTKDVCRAKCDDCKGFEIKCESDKHGKADQP